MSRYAGREYRGQAWGMDGGLLLGFWAELEGADRITVDTSELASAEWVRREDVERPPNTRTLTYDLIERFRLGKEWE